MPSIPYRQWAQLSDKDRACVADMINTFYAQSIHHVGTPVVAIRRKRRGPYMLLATVLSAFPLIFFCN